MSFNNTTSEVKAFILSNNIKVVLGIDFVVIVVAFCLHVLGITLLVQRKLENITPQNILIIHLSLISIINVFTNGTADLWKFQGARFTKAFIAVYYIAHMAYILNLIILSVDRFLFVRYPFRYKEKLYFVRILAFITINIIWILSIIFGMVIRYGVDTMLLILFFFIIMRHIFTMAW